MIFQDFSLLQLSESKDSMFSGIIEDLGKVADIKQSDEGAVITLRTGCRPRKSKSAIR